jgi:nucleoside-diphosphate-sugar epimerase
MSDVWIVGCGYVGTRVARAEQAEGNSVTAVVRTAESAHRLAGLGLHAVQHDLDHPSTPGLSMQDAVVYYFVPPPSHGTTDPRLARFLAALGEASRVQRLVLISTSGVYGDCHGEWVTEARAAHPEAERAQRRWDAEQTARQWSAQTGVPVVILRVPGIYGPGRLPLERLRAGEPVLNEAESPWSNRVHVDDLVASCLAAVRRGQPGAVYNISDGTPTTMTDYFNRVADAAGLPRPPQISMREADVRLSPGMRSYLAESKRLDNRAMREELGVTPRYPDLASGLAACLRSGVAA